MTLSDTRKSRQLRDPGCLELGIGFIVSAGAGLAVVRRKLAGLIDGHLSGAGRDTVTQKAERRVVSDRVRYGPIALICAG